MAPGKECDICTATLDEACKRFGREYCELQAQYETTGMTTEQVTVELVSRLHPDQVQVIREALIDRGVATAK